MLPVWEKPENPIPAWIPFRVKSGSNLILKFDPNESIEGKILVVSFTFSVGAPADPEIPWTSFQIEAFPREALTENRSFL